MRRTSNSLGAIAVTALLASGCYGYLPVDAGAPPSGDRIRVVLTSEGSRELARVLGPGVTVAEGTVSAHEMDGTIQLGVDYVHLQNGMRMPWTGEGTVRIPASYRESVARRTYLRRQSIVAGGALAALLVTTAVVAIRAGGAGGSDGPGVPMPPALVPPR